MTHTLRLLLAVLGLAVLSLTAQAAVDPTDVLIKALIEKNVITEDDAAAVRAEIANTRQEEDAARKSYPVTGKRPLKVSGYLQTRYTSSDDDTLNSGFEVKRARLQLAGDATPVIDYKLQMDFAGAKKAVTAVNSDPTKSKTDLFGKPTLLDAVIGYKLSQNTRFQAGQFYIPFGLENITSDAVLDTINRSQTTERLVPGRDTGNQGRDIGIQFGGIRPLDSEGSRALEYAVALLNGAGINTGDDNGRADVAAHVLLKPGIDGLAVGGSYFNGATGTTRVPHERTGLELVYRYGGWAVKGEYLTGKDDVSKHGYYGTLVRNLSKFTQAVVRYDHVSSSAFKTTDTVKPSKVTTVGLNWFLSKDTQTRIAVNYELRREDGAQVANDQLLAQFQASF
ncbi:MAG TPA: porin [Armatimonadota bacterium]|jgi:hypothetical protein